MSDQILPNFLVIGSPKAGTTWLYNVLKQHPRIFLPEKKEVNFFYKHILVNDLAWYASYYRDPAAKNAQAVGDITPLYCKMSLAGVRNAKLILPDAKIIMVARDPIERDLSNAVFDLGYVERKSREDLSEFTIYQHCMRLRTRRGSDYQAIYDRWCSVFGADSVYVAQFEDLRRRPDELICDIIRHIGVEPILSLKEAVNNAKKGDSETLISSSHKVEATDFLRWALAKRWAPIIQKINIPGLDTLAWERHAQELVARPAPCWRFKLWLFRIRALPETIFYRAYDTLRSWHFLWRGYRVTSKWLVSSR